MSLMGAFFEGLFGPLGKKAASWIPDKEEILRRKINKYEKQLYDLKQKKWTTAIGIEYDRIDILLRAERRNLEIHLSKN